MMDEYERRREKQIKKEMYYLSEKIKKLKNKMVYLRDELLELGDNKDKEIEHSKIKRKTYKRYKNKKIEDEAI